MILNYVNFESREQLNITLLQKPLNKSFQNSF
jgi:hypothetical protein